MFVFLNTLIAIGNDPPQIRIKLRVMPSDQQDPQESTGAMLREDLPQNEFVELPIFSPYTEEKKRRIRVANQNLASGGGKKPDVYGMKSEKESSNYHELRLQHGSHRKFQTSCTVGLRTKLYCPVWMMDRSGAVDTVDNYPSFYGLTLIGNADDEDPEAHKLKIGRQHVELPADYCVIPKVNLCVQVSSFTVMDAQCRAFNVLPRIIFHNTSTRGRGAGGGEKKARVLATVFEILPIHADRRKQQSGGGHGGQHGHGGGHGHGHGQQRSQHGGGQHGHGQRHSSDSRGSQQEPLVWTLPPDDVLVPNTDIEKIRFRVQGMTEWSHEVLLSEDMAGDVPFVLQGTLSGATV